MPVESFRPKLVIRTSHPDVTLVELSGDGIGDYYALIDKDRDHLTNHGDYLDMKTATLESVSQSLKTPPDGDLRMGIWRNEELMGRVELAPKEPGIFVIGYWLGGDFTGNGYVTISCRVLIEYGRDLLGATDVYAGVAKGNGPSEAVLARIGFEYIADMGAYSRLRLRLVDRPRGR